MAKEQLWHGKTKEDLKNMDLKEFATFIPSRERRKINRGFTEMEKVLLKKLAKGSQKLKTHCRDMVITPVFLDQKISIHTGKEWVMIQVTTEMLGHRLGEFAITRGGVKHSAPGVGATRSSAAISVK